MFISQIYKYELEGIIYVGATELPNGATLIETMDILNADNGYELQRKKDSIIMGTSVWLHDGDNQDNYVEVESKEEQ